MRCNVLAGFHIGFSVLGGGGRCCVWNRLSDENLTQLRIAMEGPDLNEVDFNEILDFFKEKNRRIRL